MNEGECCYVLHSFTVSCVSCASILLIFGSEGRSLFPLLVILFLSGLERNRLNAERNCGVELRN
jgi:hypothetical protein